MPTSRDPHNRSTLNLRGSAQREETAGRVDAQPSAQQGASVGAKSSAPEYPAVRRPRSEASPAPESNTQGLSAITARVASLEKAFGDDGLTDRLDTLFSSAEVMSRSLAAVEKELQELLERATSEASRLEILSAKVEEIETELAQRFLDLESRLSDVENAVDEGGGGEPTQEHNLDLAERLDTAIGRASASLREEFEARLEALGDVGSAEDSKTTFTRLPEASESALESRLAEVVARLEKLEGAQGATTSDLTSVRGIGPKYAAALCELGVSQRNELAALDDDGVDEIAKSLGVPPKRVRKWRDAADS